MKDEKPINIIRLAETERSRFVILDKRFLYDKDLSLKAKGMLAFLLAKPDDWQIYIESLSNELKEGRDAVAAALNELIEQAYIRRSRDRDQSGAFRGYLYTVYESRQDSKVIELPTKKNSNSPKRENPDTGNPDTGNPDTGNPQLRNTDLRNTDLRNIDGNEKREEGREERAVTSSEVPSKVTDVPSPLPLVSISQEEKTAVQDDYSDFETIYRRHTSYPLFSRSTGESHRAALNAFIKKHGRELALTAFEAFTEKKPGKDLKYFCVEGDEGEKIIADMVKPEKNGWVDYLYDSLDYDHFRKLCGFADNEGTRTIHTMLKNKHRYAWDFVNEAVKKCANDPQKIRDYLFSTEKFNEWLRIQTMCGDKPVRKRRLRPDEWICPVCGEIARGSICYGERRDEDTGAEFRCLWARVDNNEAEKLSAAQADFTMFKRDPVAYAEKTRQEAERVKRLMDEFRAKHAEAAA